MITSLRLCPKGVSFTFEEGGIPLPGLGGACQDSRKLWGLVDGRVGRNGNPRQFRVVSRTAISLMDPRPDQKGRLKLMWRPHPLGIHPPHPFRREDLWFHSSGLG